MFGDFFRAIEKAELNICKLPPFLSISTEPLREGKYEL